MREREKKEREREIEREMKRDRETGITFIMAVGTGGQGGGIPPIFYQPPKLRV